MPSILLFGSTGLIGSHLVVALKKAYPSFHLTVYLRNKNADTYLTSAVGVDRIVHGDFSELEKISILAKDHDIVINSGSSWDVPLTRAIVDGLRQRPTEAKGTLIHISGTGNFSDHTKAGKSNPEAKVYNDDNEEDMRLINANMLNGGCDVEVLEGGKDGRINTYIIFPSGVYGPSVGPLSAPGVIQVFMEAKAKELGVVPYIGEGSSNFNSIHVGDIAPFVLKVLELSLSDEPKGSVYSRCFIVGSQNDSWKTACTAFAKQLHAKGVISSPIPKSFAYGEAGGGELVDLLMPGNMYFKTDRATRLGFKPVHPSLTKYLRREAASHMA
ncbi:MAG: hypothetical protein M1824_002752 [Vezdaea acicularis]|nr:MAG: hypothetical protein M1824_002752 [Vezdaea acicularis]